MSLSLVSKQLTVICDGDVLRQYHDHAQLVCCNIFYISSSLTCIYGKYYLGSSTEVSNSIFYEKFPTNVF